MNIKSISFILLLSFSCTSTNDYALKSRNPACASTDISCFTTNNSLELIPASENAYSSSGPAAWVASASRQVIEEIDLRSEVPPAELTRGREIEIKATRNALTKGVFYKEGIVEISDYSLFLTDKLIAAKVLEHYLGDDFSKYHMKTVGLKEFLDRNGIVDQSGRVIRSRAAIKEILKIEFPHGFIAKPPVGYDSNGKSFFSDLDEVADFIVKGDNELYEQSEYRSPFKADFARRFTSGEKFIFQAKLDGAMGVSTDRAAGSFDEYRVHSLYNKVVEGATLNRWDGKNSKEDILRVNAFVQEMLDKLPASMSNRQGWSFDVFKLPNGELKVIEINTNRGLLANWSDWLRHPYVLGAYVRHLETHYRWKFKGFSGWLLRHNLGGLKRYWWDDRAGRWHDLKIWFGDTFSKKIAAVKSAEEAKYLSRIDTCQSLWCYSGRKFFDEKKMPRVGLEVELSGLNEKKIVEILQKTLGATVEEKAKEYSYVDPITKKTVSATWSTYKIKAPGMARIHVKPEPNTLDNGDFAKAVRETRTFEIITDPYHYDQVEKFQKALDALKAAGAVGTNSDTPVSIQVNVEMLDERNPSVVVEDILSILRNYYRPEHYRQINDEIPLPKAREAYVGPYSPGMMEKLFDSTYAPSFEEFYDDFFYRQSAEYLEYEGAWSDSIDEVSAYIKANLKKDDFTKILRVFKWNDIRVSSLLIGNRPDEWMSKFLLDSGWVAPHPVFEFRRPNNNFDALSAVRSAVGMVERSRAVGEFQFEAVLAAEHGLRAQDVKRLIEIADADTKPFVVSQVLGDRDELIESERADLKKVDEVRSVRNLLVEVPMNSAIDKPFVVPGESVVWHRLGSTSQNIVGKYNPALVNANVSTVLENKYVEAKFWQKYAPGAMPKTTLLSDIVSAKRPVDEVLSLLNKEFSKGWVIKGTYDNNTDAKFLITNDTDIKGELAKFEASKEEFLEYLAQMKQEYEHTDPDLFNEKLKARPEYNGWRINRVLKKPFRGMVQERLDLDIEYRVEVVAGKVLGRESTVPRYYYADGLDELPSDYWSRDKNLPKVEKYAQEVVDQLPEHLKGMTFAMDVVVLKDGTTKLIETNPQGNSGFLFLDHRAHKLLEDFLLSYPAALKRGEIDLGMSEADQMRYLKDFLEGELKLDLDEQFPHLKFTAKGLLYVAGQFSDKSCEALAKALLK